MKRIEVDERVQKFLSRAAHFRTPESFSGQSRTWPRFADEERVVAVYENTVGVMEERIVFTEIALHYVSGMRWISVPYRTVISVGFPRECDRNNAIAVRLTKIDGREHILPVRGRGAGITDAVIVREFLSAVSQDAVWDAFQREAVGQSISR